MFRPGRGGHVVTGHKPFESQWQRSLHLINSACLLAYNLVLAYSLPWGPLPVGIMFNTFSVAVTLSTRGKENAYVGTIAFSAKLIYSFICFILSVSCNIIVLYHVVFFCVMFFFELFTGYLFLKYLYSPIRTSYRETEL